MTDVLAREAPETDSESAKRRQILDGARRVFFSDGFDGASMNDIARVAGVSKGTLYVYFDSKETLFEALIREDRRRQVERFVIPEAEDDLPTALKDFGRQLMELMTQPEMIAQVRIVIAATAKFPSLGKAFYESGPCYGELRLGERLEKWRARGVLEFDDGRRAARHFIDLCKSGIHLPSLLGFAEAATPQAIAENVDRAVEVFMRAYGARAASTSGAMESGASVGA
jgi:AcrR family transcriptional regulator